MAWRTLVSPLGALLLGASAALSQDVNSEIVIPPDLPQPAEMATLVWDTFKTECGMAFSDPEAFLQSVPDPDQEGRQTTAASQDGQTLHIYKKLPGNKITIQVDLYGVEDGLLVRCSSGFLDEAGTAAFYGNRDWSDPNSANYLAYVRANERALRTFIGSDTGKTVSGGVSELRNWPPGPNSLFAIGGALSVTTDIGGIRMPLLIGYAALGAGVEGTYVRPYD